MCCQGTQQCTCAFYTCPCHCCAECNSRRAQREREQNAPQPPPQDRTQPGGCAGCLLFVVPTFIVVIIIVAVIHMHIHIHWADLHWHVH